MPGQEAGEAEGKSISAVLVKVRRANQATEEKGSKQGSDKSFFFLIIIINHIILEYFQGAEHNNGANGKEPAGQCRRCRRHMFDPWVRKTHLEEGMATHSSILAWRIPWIEEPGGLQS